MDSRCVRPCGACCSGESQRESEAPHSLRPVGVLHVDISRHRCRDIRTRPQDRSRLRRSADILDADAFATRLGIDVAIALDPLSHIESQSALDLVRLTQSTFQKVVHVHYGPVVYEDHSGVIRTERDLGAFPRFLPRPRSARRSHASNTIAARHAFAAGGGERSDHPGS